MNNIAIPSCFDFTFVMKKEITNIISALQMAQAPSSLKCKIEIIFYVNCLNLTPHMAIMFLDYSLHLPRVIVSRMICYMWFHPTKFGVEVW
jgi:hypothetical protein